jgi:hypothetical protein
MMRSKIVLSGLVLALVASNAHFAARRQTVVIYRDDFASTIDDMVRHQGRRFVLVIGDSITERSTLPLEICGGPLVKLGIGGSRASTFIPFAEVMNSRKIAPSLIVVALGLNDANEEYRSGFRVSYNLLLDTLPKAPLILATLTPVADERMSRASKVDEIIRNTAAERSIDSIDLSKLRDFRTIDGIHLTDAAYASWNEQIIAAIERSSCPDR